MDFFQHPPLIKDRRKENSKVFHEPDSIEEFLQKNKDIDLVLHGHTHRYFNERLKALEFSILENVQNDER